MAVDHTERKHALLSASGASRWMNCTPSARLSEHLENKSSIYADEGTLAHEFGDVNLRAFFGQITKEEHRKNLKELREHELYTDDMEEHVEIYTDHVIEQFNVANQNGSALISIEEKLDFSHVVPKGFGTGDATIIADGVLDVSDLKYGRGVAVYAEKNSQLMLYGIGALHKYEMLYDIHTVRLTIVQPRKDSISTYSIAAEDLKSWAENTVKPAAAKAWAGEGDLKAGDHCRWCDLKPTCRAFNEMNLEVARKGFAEDPFDKEKMSTLTDAEMLDIYEKLDTFSSWLKAIKTYFLDAALGGKKWPGYKVVLGRANRRWGNPEEVMAQLDSDGFGVATYTTQKLNGIGKISNLMSKDAFKNKYEPLLIKPQGAPSLVREEDKRPEFGAEQAALDFDDGFDDLM